MSPRVWPGVALAVLGIALAGADPTAAQIPGLPRPRDILGRVPSLSSFLEGDPPITTSLDDARTEIAFLDLWSPRGWQRLDRLPRTGQGAFRLRPGRFAMEAQSYCMHAGTHGPGGGDGYLLAPLAGSKAPIVQSLLQNSVAHPEVPQQNIQGLIWAIIARTEFDEMPREMQQTARTLLSRDQIKDLDKGALGLVPESVMREAMSRLPPVARQVFEAEARLRSMISSGTSSFAELERVAVLTGAVEPPEGSRPVPEDRWSFDPDGYFVRYDPSGYSRTRVEVSVPRPVAIARDAAGRIAGVYDGYGRRLETGAGGVRFARFGRGAGETVLGAAPPPAGEVGGPVVQVLAHVLGSGSAPADALRDLAELEGLARALAPGSSAMGAGASAPGGAAPERAASREAALDLVVEAWQATFCLAAGCPGFASGQDVLVLRTGAFVRGELAWCAYGTCVLGGGRFERDAIEWIGLARAEAIPPAAVHPEDGEVHRRDGSVVVGDLVSLGDQLVVTDAGGHERSGVAWIHLVAGEEEEPAGPIGGAPGPPPVSPPGTPGEDEDRDEDQSDGPVFDPSDDVATPGNRGRQRLAQSPRRTEDEEPCAEERRRFEEANAEWDAFFPGMERAYDRVVDEVGISTLAEMEAYSGPGEALVQEYLELKAQGDVLNQRAVDAETALMECEEGHSCADERQRFEDANAEWDAFFPGMERAYDRVVDEVGISTLAEMEAYSGPGEALVQEYLELKAQGDELNQRAVDAETALMECEEAAP